MKKIEIRCPIYGFIELDEWEYDIISHPAFQRLRRIRQLALTDYIYPGAMHTRFEHSLGVMQMVSFLFDGIRKNSEQLLSKIYKIEELDRIRVILRLAALLHDVGHAPFSHPSEDSFPKDQQGTKYVHEDYSDKIISKNFKSLIENHPVYRINSEDVAGFIKDQSESFDFILWKDLISGQVDADRMDYLLRDSHHCGVEYGKYDWKRLVNTIKVVKRPEIDEYAIGFSEGGWHAAESLIVARYLMFTQVYSHKTRIAYNYHLNNALKEILPNQVFPTPNNIDEYLEWDDWKVLGSVSSKNNDEHSSRILNRNHYRMIYHTKDVLTDKGYKKYEKIKEVLKDIAIEIPDGKNWYKEENEILIEDSFNFETRKLSQYSNVVKNLKTDKTFYFYVDIKNVAEAKEKLSRMED